MMIYANTVRLEGPPKHQAYNVGMWNRFLCRGLLAKDKSTEWLFFLEATAYADKAGFLYPHHQGRK